MKKIEALLNQEKNTFHTSDLALLWGIDNKSTLRITLKRYVDKGILKRIHKGFYSKIDINKLDPIDLGYAYLNTYAYLSLESILVKEGVIYQDVNYITFVSTKSTTFKINSMYYKSKQLKDRFLYESTGIIKVKNHFEATKERAIADALYYNPNYHFDNTVNVNLDKVQLIRRTIGYA